MSAHARVTPAPFTRGVHVTVWPSDSVVRLWESHPMRQLLDEGGLAEPAGGDSHSPHLALREDEARALYEALAEHFGHAGHDIRALRKDYDAERVRVDKFINNLIGGNQ